MMVKENKMRNEGCQRNQQFRKAQEEKKKQLLYVRSRTGKSAALEKIFDDEAMDPIMLEAII
jgi:hypothetical protein